jgi:penicillin-binding protein 1C
MCRIGRSFENRTFVRLPVDVRRWLQDTSQNLPAPPPLAGFCAKAQTLDAPVIVTPSAGQEILLMAGVAAEDQKIALEAELPEGSMEASWFVDGAFIGTSAEHERLWWAPSEGRHELLVADETGAQVRRTIQVRRP